MLSTGGKVNVSRSPDYDDTIRDAFRDLVLDSETPSLALQQSERFDQSTQ